MLQPGGPGLRCVRQLCVADAGLCGGGSQRSHSLLIAGRCALILMHSNLEIDIAVAGGHRVRMLTNRCHVLEANMKKQITLVALLGLLLGLSAISAMAQLTGTAKGTCKDVDGKPIADGVVVWTKKKVKKTV